MGLKLYNTASRRKEDFVPVSEDKVNFYACGVTVYDMSHIGHARTMIAYDIVFRHLKHRGYNVNFIRNFTDVDDKIINRANEQGVAWDEIPDKYIEEFYKDMDALGIQRPTNEPKATQYMDAIIGMVEKLIENGHAYESEGDVYYSVNSFEGYGKLSGRNLDDMEAGHRVAVGDKKKEPYDFALWKASKPGEPMWDSPWGKGRPGWHIECSAMSTSLCGSPTLDIHSGGKDLVFPHHENEIAQSEGATGEPFVKYWLHSGFVNVDSEKMSKSLNNFFTIRDVLEKYPPEAMRQFLLGTHYRKPIDYNDKSLEEAQQAVDRLYSAWETLDATLALDSADPLENADGLSEADKALYEEIVGFHTSFEDAMDDDFNTARAMGYQFELVRRINALASGEVGDASARPGLLATAREVFFGMNAILGTMIRSPEEYRQAVTDMKMTDGLEPVAIEEMIAARLKAREEKNWAEADRIRDELAEKGVILKDSKEGTTWTLK